MLGKTIFSFWLSASFLWATGSADVVNTVMNSIIPRIQKNSISESDILIFFAGVSDNPLVVLKHNVNPTDSEAFLFLTRATLAGGSLGHKDMKKEDLLRAILRVRDFSVIKTIMRPYVTEKHYQQYNVFMFENGLWPKEFLE